MLPGKELKRNNTFPRNREVNETNESREGLDWSCYLSLAFGFCYSQIRYLKQNLISKFIMKKMNANLINDIYTNTPG